MLFRRYVVIGLPELLFHALRNSVIGDYRMLVKTLRTTYLT